WRLRRAKSDNVSLLEGSCSMKIQSARLAMALGMTAAACSMRSDSPSESEGNLRGGGAGGTSGSTTNSAGAACSDVAPCGGNAVGTWTVASACLAVAGNLDVSGFGLGCPTVTVTGSLQVSGTWTANADGTYADNTTTTGDEQLTVPAECLNVSGTTT